MERVPGQARERYCGLLIRTISPRDDLDAGAARGRTERELVLVEAVPAVEVGPLDAARAQQLGDRGLLRRDARATTSPPGR